MADLQDPEMTTATQENKTQTELLRQERVFSFPVRQDEVHGGTWSPCGQKEAGSLLLRVAASQPGPQDGKPGSDLSSLCWTEEVQSR